jgi:dipeptidyl-peptidase-2
VIHGGEATMNTKRIGSPFVSDSLASEFGAAVVQTEHRFYGESKPSDDELMYQYLTVEQVLEDYASLIAYLGSLVDCEGTKIVGVFGGSYPGALAGLMRLRYPHLVDFAHASSAPLGFYGGHTRNKFDFYKIVTEQVGKIDSECPKLVKTSLNALENIDLARLPICHNLDTSVEELVQIVRAFFANQNMPNYPPGKGGLVVNNLCQRLRQRVNEEARVVAMFTFLAEQQMSGKDCFDVGLERPSGSAKAVCADHSGCGSGNDGRSWDYQACTELEHAIASNGETDMFPPMEFSRYLLEQYCLDRFGVSPQYSKLNTVWGIERIDQLVSRILFVNGARDGWTASTITNATHAILIPNGAHHSEMGAPRDDDTDDMREARDKIVEIIRGFISDIQAELMADQGTNFTYETV